MRKSVRFLLRILVPCLALPAGGCAVAPGLHDFTSDGCSLFPDGDVKDRELRYECCFEHDIAYWRDGTDEDRKKADKALQACVRERTGDKALADLMYQGVHIVFQDRPKEEAIDELKNGGYGYHSVYGNIPAFIRDADIAQIKQKVFAP